MAQAEAETIPSSSTAATPAGDERDVADGRYRIHLDRPLPHLSSATAQAYDASDLQGKHSSLYALICPSDVPYRNKAMEAWRTIQHPSLLPCYAAAAVALSSPAEMRMALVLQKPRGRKLSEILAEQGPLPERQVIQKILTPLTELISALHGYKINHGCINPDRLYFDDTLLVGECISEPSGYSQHPFYEPPERATCLPYAKGSGDLSADAYAIGVLTIHLCHGDLPFNQLTPKQFLQRLLHMGCYNAFMQNLDFTENVLDLLRGTLIDNPAERWQTNQLSLCLAGKRYNLIPPSIPRDSTRPFTFNGQEFFNRKALAQGIADAWRTGRQDLSPSKLIRWVELSAHKSDAAETLSKVLHAQADGPDDPSRILNDGELSRAIAVLDPHGPMRLRDLAVNMDALGTVLAYSFRDKNPGLQQQLTQLIESGLPGFISDLPEFPKNPESSNTLWQLQNLRPVAALKGMGFGPERVLYFLNPSLPCQSPLLRAFHCTEVSDTLYRLEAMAADAQKHLSLIDAHLGAFLAQKLDIKKELKIVELAAFPDFYADPRLTILKLLATAQQKIGNPRLPGLAQWVCATVLPVIGKFHQKSSREWLMKEVKNATKSGLLERIAAALFQGALVDSDKREYERAKALFKFHQENIRHLENDKNTRLEARELGRKVSVTIAYLLLMTMLYVAFDPMMHL